MVKPPPDKPPPKKQKRRVSAPPPPPDPYAELRELLELFGNDRAYSVIRCDKNGWLIHLSGDTVHTLVKWDGEKPVMIKEGE